MKAALYVRVSTKEQNVHLQLAELRDYAGKRGWKIVAEYEDAGVSGGKVKRPALSRLEKDARARKFDVLIVWKLDRLGRSLQHLVTLLSDLDRLGVTFVSLRDGFDLGTASGRLHMQIIAAMAEYERALITERVVAGMRLAKKNGKHCGRPRREVDAVRVRKLRASGASWTAIAVAVGAPRSVCQRAY